MKYEELIILLPCHSLEDFPLYHEGDEAEGLLAGWSAMWHPALLAAAQAIPTWHRADDPPETFANRLIIVPSVSQAELAAGLIARARREGACVVDGRHRRDEIVEAALAELDGADAGINERLAGDFLALGFCYLQVELLTRQMRYTSNLDEAHLQSEVLAAANAAVGAEDQKAFEHLSACFDALAEARDQFYPTDSYIIDLTLLAETTLGSPLRDELSCGAPVNLMMSAEVLALMGEKHPESLAALHEALEQGRASIVGGELTEEKLPLMPLEAILAGLRRGLGQYDGILGRRPKVFGRRRFGLTPVLPQIIEKLHFKGVLHATLDDGRFPEGAQTKTRWEGADGSTVDALAKVPLDATRAETFLNYSVKMGESMDMDHVATVCMAHWPGRTSCWYEDLRRIACYVPVLGKFVSLDDYFNDTDMPGQLDRFAADQYRSPYLAQAVAAGQADPISTTAAHYGRRAKAEAHQALSTLVSLLRGRAVAASGLIDEVDQSGDDATKTCSDGIDVRLDEHLGDMAQQLAGCLPRAESGETAGCLVVNPCSFARRVGVDVSGLDRLPAIGGPVFAAGQSQGRKHAVVDVPSMGFAWVAPGAHQAGKRPVKPLAEADTLCNEYLEARINPTTGTLQSIYDFRTRGNRFSQQIALRTAGPPGKPGEIWRNPDERAVYSVMAADSVKVTASDAALGEITCGGRILDRQGQILARFEQKYRLWRGSRVLEILIELDTHEEPAADPWNSYYACRFAWASEAAELFCGVGLGRHRTSAKRLESPHYIEIKDADLRTTVLTGGLPYHRRAGMRMLDTLLIVRGERARQFRLGIGIDLSHPAPESLSLLAPSTVVPESAPPPKPSPSGWLFHLNAKNVIATHWEPLVEDEQISGFRVRLLETTGRPGRISISSFRPVAFARQVDFQGHALAECEVTEDKIRVDMTAHEWAQIEARWQTG